MRPPAALMLSALATAALACATAGTPTHPGLTSWGLGLGWGAVYTALRCLPGPDRHR